jgi:hypothetical protein
MQKMNSWPFSSLNNIPDGAPACADLVLQTTFPMVHLRVLISSCKPHDQGTKHLGPQTAYS